MFFRLQTREFQNLGGPPCSLEHPHCVWDWISFKFCLFCLAKDNTCGHLMRDEKRASYELAGRKLLKTRTELILFRNAFCTSRTISRSAHKERKIWFYAIFVLPHNQICQDMLKVASSALLKSVSHKLCFLHLVLPSLKASKLSKLSSVVPPPYTSLVNTL